MRFIDIAIGQGFFFLLSLGKYLINYYICYFFQQGKVYQFDNILKPNVTQENVYNTAAKDIVKGKKVTFKSS